MELIKHSGFNVFANYHFKWITNFNPMKSKYFIIFSTILFLQFFILPVYSQHTIQLKEPIANPFPLIKSDHTTTPWYLEMKSLRPNILKAEKEFDQYFEQHPEETSKQKKAFIRWLETARLSMDEDGFNIPYSILPEHQNSGLKLRSTRTWRMIGPNFAAKTTCGTSSSLSGGFCDRVYINPKNTNNLFAGFSYGGLWVSLDQGKTWDLKDAEFSNGTNTYANRDYYYGDIEASKVDSALIFAATEAGLLKSINSGTTWTLCPQLNRNSDASLRPYFLALSTTTTSIVLASFGRKIFRSTDGGNTWNVSFDNSAGGNNHHYTSQYNDNSTFGIYDRTYNFFGIEADHNNPNTFYLGVWNSNNEACIYKSSNGGASFNLLVNLDVLLRRNMPDNLIFQTIPAQPDRFYIYPQFASDTLYIFSDTGQLIRKTKIGTTVEACDINWLDEKIMYTGFYGASSVMKSEDGGISFTDKTSGYGGCPKYVHPDVRSLDAVGNFVLIGSDGGIALSIDSMNSVNTIGREISSIDLWGFSSSPKSDIASAGCDHGPTKIRRYDGNDGWHSMGGGDAGQTSVNQSNDRWIYFDHGYGIFKTQLDTNNNLVNTVGINPGISLHRTEFHPNLYNVSYGISGTQVKMSRDNFSTFNLFYDFGKTLNVFKVAQHDTTVMYALLNNNEINKSLDAGKTWTVITPSGSVSNGQKNIVDISLGDDPLEIYAAYGNSQNSTKALKSIDGGLSWINITTSNLPTTPVSQMVYQRGTQGGIYLAFAGQSGVWYRNNLLTEWKPLGTGLAMLGYVRNIYTVPAKGKFRMGSSRGSWEHNLYEESLTPIANFSCDNNVSRCPLTPISFYQNCSHSSGPANYSWNFPGGIPSTSHLENPQVRYSNPGKYSVSLTVIDQYGNRNTKTLKDFITVESSICAADTTADVMLDIPRGSTTRIPLAPVPIAGNEFTITCWLKLTGLQNSFAQIVSTNSPNTRFGLGFAFMGYTPNTNLIFTLDGVGYGITSTINMDTTGWHHVALTYSATQVKIYVDGKIPWIYNGNFAKVDFSKTNFWINNDIHNQGGDFHGQIDELCFYNRALSQEEIREKIHLVKNPLKENELKAYYQFNQYDSRQSILYEIISGIMSSISNKLIATSPIPVASGSFHRIPDVTNGISNFTNTGIHFFIPTSIAPDGEMVVTRLNTAPFGIPNGITSISKHYWVIRNWGNQTIATPTLISFSPLGNLSNIELQYPALSHKLYKRAANDFGNTWGSAIANPDSLTIENNGTAFYGNSTGITSFGQFVIGSVICNSEMDSISICHGDSILIDGLYKKVPGIYYSRYLNSNNCDSVVERILKVEDPMDTMITITGNTLKANGKTETTYQWINCNDGNSIISGETNQSFTPKESGNYAVILMTNGCIDTSTCIPVLFVGTNQNDDSRNEMMIYPNPSQGIFNIISFKHNINAYAILDALGKTLISGDTEDKRMSIELSFLDNGMYFFKSGHRVYKLIKQNTH